MNRVAVEVATTTAAVALGVGAFHILDKIYDKIHPIKGIEEMEEPKEEPKERLDAKQCKDK
jgi:hypothetical protein